MEIHHPCPADGLGPDTSVLLEKTKCKQYLRAFQPCLSPPTSPALLLSQSTAQWDREGEEQNTMDIYSGENNIN